MSEKQLGTCDWTGRGDPSYSTTAHQEPHEKRVWCSNWRPSEPVASPQATRPTVRVLLDELGKLEHRQLRDEHGREIKGALWVKLHDVAGMIGRWAAQPAAGTTTVTGHKEYVQTDTQLMPSEGTTPQAERLELLALRKKFKDEHMLNRQDSDRSEELIEIICGRAVAPVETPLTPYGELMQRVDDYRSGYSCGYSDAKNGTRMRDKDAAQLFFGQDASGIPDVSEHQLDQAAQTRLTAEQFWKEVMHFPKEVIRKLTMWECEKLDQIIIESLEAFRDKSEEELRAKLAALTKRFEASFTQCINLGAEVAALRERERWIPVGERWPQANEFVHVVIGGIFQMVPARLIDDRWYWFIEEADTAPKDAVTHWKALSAAPERGKEAKS